MSRTIGEALRVAVDELSERLGRAEAERDARRLLQACLGLTGAGLTARLQEPLGDEEARAFRQSVTDRSRGMSVAHILQSVEFYGRPFHVTVGDLVPRPDTETLVDHALSAPFDRVLDLGTGTGAIAITLLCERASATGVATDLTRDNLKSAEANRERFGLQSRLTLAVADWFDGVEGAFDLIVSNPPYVSEADYAALQPEISGWERREALTPGGDGLDAYRSIARDAPGHLTPGGRLLVEIGFDQGAAVTTLFRDAGLADVTLHPDMNGKDRVVAGRRP